MNTGRSVGFVILKLSQAVGGKGNVEDPTGRISVGFTRLDVESQKVSEDLSKGHFVLVSQAVNRVKRLSTRTPHR